MFGAEKGMSGFDLIIKNRVLLPEIRKALSAVFGLPEGCVFAIEGYPEETLSDSVKILSMSTEVGGDFQTHLSIELLDSEVRVDFTLIAARLSHELKSECLFPDSSENPYSMWLISPDFSNRRVNLRADDCDNGEYRLIKGGLKNEPDDSVESLR